MSGRVVLVVGAVVVGAVVLGLELAPVLTTVLLAMLIPIAAVLIMWLTFRLDTGGSGGF